MKIYVYNAKFFHSSINARVGIRRIEHVGESPEDCPSMGKFC